MKELDKFTLGKTPAAIYLVSILNTTTNSNDKSVLKKITHFKGIFAEFNNAYKNNHITRQSMLHFCNLKRLEISQMKNEKLSPLVFNLFKNLLLADIKQFTRTHNHMARIEHSALHRGKNILQEQNSTLLNTTINTYGKISKHDNKEYPIEVSFNEFGTPKIVKQFDNNILLDNISDEYLLDKFIKKHKAKGNDYGI